MRRGNSEGEIVRLISGYSDGGKLKFVTLDPASGVGAEDLDQILFGQVLLDIANPQPEDHAQHIVITTDNGPVQTNKVSA